MLKWDRYVTVLQYNNDQRLPRFTETNIDSDYLIFRLVMQAIDLMLLDLDHYAYDPRDLSLAALVLVLDLTLSDQDPSTLITAYTPRNPSVLAFLQDVFPLASVDSSIQKCALSQEIAYAQLILQAS